MNKFVNFMLKVKKNFLAALYPLHLKCINCGVDLPKLNTLDLCEKCRGELQLNNGKRCVKCGKNVVGNSQYCWNCKNSPRNFEKASAPWLYVGIGAKLIKKFKYKNAPYLAKTFARILAQEYAKSDFEVDVVVPVPMHIDKKVRRGYNQAELLAKEFCKIVSLPLDTSSLIKVQDTDTQTHKTKEERKNLENVYSLSVKNAFRKKRVLLIDDVITTGATLDACSKVMKASKVYGLALAHSKSKVRAALNNEKLQYKKYIKKHLLQK